MSPARMLASGLLACVLGACAVVPHRAAEVQGIDPPAARSGDDWLGDWPYAASPDEVGRRIVDGFLARVPEEPRHYKIACTWYGALVLAATLDDRARFQALVVRYADHRDDYEALLAGPGHVDENVFGIVPLAIARLANDPGARRDGLRIADHQRMRIDAHARYAIDDMYMVTALQVQAWRVSGDRAHLDLAADTMVDYLDALQQDDGLFVHHPDFRHRWARGNGWVAAGMTELLRELPAGHPRHAAIHAGYGRMMQGLRAHQITVGDGTGLWRQVIDSDDPRNWPETSGSAMFAYALVTGVRNGWLDPDAYGPVARIAWLALVARLTPAGELRDVSMWAYRPGSHPRGPDYAGDEEDYYFQRPRLTGDEHGQAPMLWTAEALLR
ncbi:glycoside hydrolase family 88 protein [Luteimonas saliphila]|uniref:glycoside hydrolase family 88 protein n=1 Tax=Luteimonas saliphila TaxID=2804919 RepID=UPI00192D4BE6|nr:glycoside hydrolase family 88 protein [Luteimonas saliphila]